MNLDELVIRSNVESIRLSDLVGRRVHVQLERPARVFFDEKFMGMYSVKVDAVDGIVGGMQEDRLTLKADALYTAEVQSEEEGSIGDIPFLQKTTLLLPVKNIGSVQLIA